MGVQIIMDRSGDTRHTLTPPTQNSVVRADERFQALISKGFRAVALGRDGNSGELIRRFDPNLEETLFIPPLKGG